MRLRRSVLTAAAGASANRGPDGVPLADEAALQRIAELVIPPAWKKVWISPYATGHIQAVGIDTAGRRQCLYHQAWQDERAEEKFDRVLDAVGPVARLAFSRRRRSGGPGYRFLFRRHRLAVLVSAAHRCAYSGLVLLGLALVGMTVVVFAAVSGQTAAVVAGPVALTAFAAAWLMVPLWMRSLPRG